MEEWSRLIRQRSYSKPAFAFDTTDMKPDTREDAKQTYDEQRVVTRQSAETGGNEHYCTYYNKE